MQRRDTEGRRQGAERDATQSMAGQPRGGDEEEHLEQPDRVPSFLTARELQAKDSKAGRPVAQESAEESEDDLPEERPAKRKESGKPR